MTGLPMPDPTDTNEIPLVGSSLDVAGEKRRALLNLFPEACTEAGSIDFDQLRRALGDAVDAGKERFGLTWPGKAACFKAIQTPSIATLLPLPGKSVDFKTTGNVIIEGDNLEVLKLLQKSYLGKIKMIYIDPPYNTGNDFIYPDNFSESLQTYLRYTGQVDDGGKRFSNNTDTDGRFHSKWLNMMYPRLYLARNLLRDDGTLFISVDDTECANLRKLCDEIYGEENFIAQMIWEGAFKNDARQIGVNHEYILVYARERARLPNAWSVRKEAAEQVLKEVQRLMALHGDDYDAASADLAGWFRASKAKPWYAHRRFRYIDRYGAYKEDDPTAPGGRRFDLRNPSTGEVIPLRRNRGWTFDQQVFDELVRAGKISFVSPQSIMVRRYFHETDTVTPQSVFYQPARSASERLAKLIGPGLFDFPKDELSIQQLVEMACSTDGDIVLDFFAGSGTTAHAVMSERRSSGRKLKFMLVQLPEPIDNALIDESCRFETIADVCEERVRRVARKMRDLDAETIESRACHWDYGFRVFKLSQSNFKEWDSKVRHDPDVLAEQLTLGVDHLRSDRTELDIVYEVLLKSGFTLTETVTSETVSGHKVYSVGDGAYLICLEQHVTLQLVRAIADRNPERVLFLDGSFAGNDQLKTNAAQAFKDKNIVFRTI